MFVCGLGVLLHAWTSTLDRGKWTEVQPKKFLSGKETAVPTA